MTLYEKALEIATREHAGQFRNDGKTPYIEHPKAVVAMVMAQIEAETAEAGFRIEDFPTTEIYFAVGILHDVLEDCPITADKLETELRTVAPERFVRAVMKAVKLLTKVQGESYFEYLARVKENTYARLIKVCDLRHNLSDLAPGKLRDKYLLAYYFLTHEAFKVQ